MKRNYITAVLAGALCAMVAACGGNSGAGEDASGAAGNAEEGTQSEEADGSEMGTAGNKTESGGNETARSLTEEELQAFTDYINEGDGWGNYGFLLSVYDTPADINLNEVFYSGAGIAAKPMSEEEQKEYLAVSGAEEIYTDVVRLEAAKLDEFLLEKTGLSYEEMNHPLKDWLYLEKFDIYCAEHGDTNFVPFTCVAGSTADEKTFTLRFMEDSDYYDGEETENGYRRLERELVVEKNGDGYRFLSNRIVTEEGQITEQTFPVTVAEYGDVTFASYETDYDQNPQADVTFMLLDKNGEIIQTLTGVCENNIRAAVESFCGVDAVAFPDYNGDGYTDAITICSYSYDQGPDVGDGFMEVRVYSGSEYGFFYYENALSDIVNAELEAPTVQAVKDFLHGANYYGTWKITGCAGTTPVYALSQEKIDAVTGTTFRYERNWYTCNGTETWISGYEIAQKTADEFREEYRVALSELGVQTDKVLEVRADVGGEFGNYFFVVDENTLLLVADGVFFTAERAGD